MSTTEDQQMNENFMRQRWGVSLNEGFLMIPRVMLKKQYALGLDSHELVVLLNLLSSWWSDNEAPYPSTQSIAARMNVSLSTVQRALRKLEKEGFIARQRNVLGRGRAQNKLVTRYEMSGTPPKVLEMRFATPPERKEKAARSEYLAGRRVRQRPVGDVNMF